MIKVLQINLNHGEVAQGLLPHLFQEEKADMELVIEQYRALCDRKMGVGYYQQGGHLGTRKPSYIKKNCCTPSLFYVGGSSRYKTLQLLPPTQRNHRRIPGIPDCYC